MNNQEKIKKYKKFIKTLESLIKKCEKAGLTEKKKKKK